MPAPDAFDAVSLEWRLALDAARDTLAAAARCGTSVPFSSTELHDRAARLVRERDRTARLLDEVAEAEHVHLLHPLSAAPLSKRALGLPAGTLACVFDLDGVLTASAAVHAAAWSTTFGEFLPRWSERGDRFAPIAAFGDDDYREHIHGRPRLEGVHAFLASRGIRLPEGRPGDAPGAATAYGLANRKNEVFQRLLARTGVAAHEGALHYLEAAREAGLHTAVVSASANTQAILASAGLAPLVEARVDGNTMRDQRLRSKPAPDTLVLACEQLGIEPEHAAAFETTAAGVEAARAAGFGFVVAVDRHGESLRAHGADVVVTELAGLFGH